MSTVRSKSGINKTDGRHEERANRVRRCCSEFLPTMVASYLEFRGWIHQDTRCNGMSVAVFRNRSIEAMRGRTNCR